MFSYLRQLSFIFNCPLLEKLTSIKKKKGETEGKLKGLLGPSFFFSSFGRADKHSRLANTIEVIGWNRGGWKVK